MDENQRVLVVADEDRIRRLIRMYLERDNFVVEEADRGRDALEKAVDNDYDMNLLDIMMPEMNGIDVWEALRKEKSTPGIMVTATGEEANRVQGFEIGAVDYIVKPFSPREVILRVKAVLRRTENITPDPKHLQSSNLIVFPHLTIDLDAYRVTADEQ